MIIDSLYGKLLDSLTCELVQNRLNKIPWFLDLSFSHNSHIGAEPRPFEKCQNGEL